MVLVVGVLCAYLFRSIEKNKKLQLQKKLETFETIEKRLSSRSIGLEEVNQLQAKKSSRVGELIKKQEKRYDQFIELIGAIFDPHSVLIYGFNPVREEFYLQAFQSQSSDLEVEHTQALEGIFKAVEAQKKPIIFQSKNEITHLSYYKKTPKLISVLAVLADLLSNVARWANHCR